MTTYTRSMTLIVDGRSYRPTDATVTLDEGWAPYAQANVVIPMPTGPFGPVTLGNLRPGAGRRVLLVITSSLGGSRTFNLTIRACQVFPETRLVGLTLSSDEALLQDYKHVGLADDKGAGMFEFSVRTLCLYALEKMGLATTPSTILDGTDADFTTSSRLTNLWPFLAGVGDGNVSYIPGTNALVVASAVNGGTYAVQPFNSSNDSFGELDVAMSPGRTYTIRAVMNVSQPQTGTLNSRARSIVVVVNTAGVDRVFAQTPFVTNTVGTRTIAMTITLPVNIKAARIRLYSGASSGGGNVGFSKLFVVEGDGKAPSGYAEDYFDGDSPVNSTYTYSWDGERGRSSSTRTPRINRSPEILTWKVGQSGWDFLKPILEATGLRLWCTEGRVWRLTRPSAATGAVIDVAQGRNLYEASELTSKTATQSDGVPLYVDAVAVKYSWVDDKGVDQERYDIASDPSYTQPFLVERPETPYPGPGAAAYLLARYRLRRRQVPVTAPLDISVSPGQPVRITHLRPEDGVAPLTGYLDAVTFDMGAQTMALKTKDLA